jgi:hypothetical protein
MLSKVFPSGIVMSDSYRKSSLILGNSDLIGVRCLGQVINLGNVDVMNQITKIASVENATAIWEYDPTLEGNRVLGGSLDVIAAIRTLAIKVTTN